MNSEAPHPSAVLASLPDAVERVAASTVGVAMRRHAASAVVWQPGVAVTSASAVWRASRLQLVLPGGEPVEGRLRGLDAATDLAAVAFDGADVPPAGRGPDDAPPPRAGDFVFAVGRQPSGLVQASFGHVGSAAGEWRSWRGGRIDRLVKLDGGLYPGLAGAPVADAAGRVIGVGSPAFSRLHGVVLPAATIDRVLAQLLAHGRVRQGYLGVAAQPARTALDGRPVDGLLIASVDTDGPAAGAGVLVGDVIVEAGGRPTASLDALRDALGGTPAGERLPLKVVRGGQPLTLDLAVAERPARSGPCGRRHG